MGLGEIGQNLVNEAFI